MKKEKVVKKEQVFERIEAKLGKKIKDLYVKLNKFYKSCYITNTGYVCTTEKRRTSILKLTDEYISDVKELFGTSFKVVKIDNIAEAKENLENSFTEVIDENEIESINKLIDLTNNIKMSAEWFPFRLSEDEVTNNDMINSLFLEGDSVEFVPRGTGTHSIIIHKTFLPYVTEKNYNDLWYSTKQASDEIIIIFFRFDFTHFEVMLMYHSLQL
jgi:hypothetical protein